MPAPVTESPIDIVYLWVDGNDPVWRAKRHRAALRLNAEQTKSMAQYGNVEGRFRDNDELRYSLRALERFFPGHGHVYLVTDGQRPPWLRDSTRLTVVSHHDLLPTDRLPTFDSGNIESYIHRIPGLSERYFYLNDDVFFGAPVQLDHWFWPGGFYAAWSDDPDVVDGPMRPGDNSLENASRLSDQWLQEANSITEAGYAHTPRTFAHAPRPMLKSLLFRLEDEAPELFERVRSGVFRTWDNPTLVSDFVLRWALAHGMAQMRDYEHLYVATGDADQSAQLAALQQASGQLAFFCINDTTDDAHGHDPRLAQVRATLQSLLPLASRFETQSLNPVHVTHKGAHKGPHKSGHQGAHLGGLHSSHPTWAHPARPAEKPARVRTAQGSESAS